MGAILNQLHTICNSYEIGNVNYQISHCFLKNIHQLDQLTLNAFIKESNTSKTSIIKFCNELGYSTWKNFIVSLIDENQRDLALYQTLALEYKITNLQGDYLLQSQRFQKTYISFLQQFSKSDLKHLVKVFKGASKIAITGDENCCQCLRSFQNFMTFQQKDVAIRSMSRKNDFSYLMESYQENDVVVVITPFENIESLLESNRFDQMLNLNRLFSSSIHKVFIGQKSVERDRYVNCQFIQLPFVNDDYAANHMILDVFHEITLNYE